MPENHILINNLYNPLEIWLSDIPQFRTIRTPEDLAKVLQMLLNNGIYRHIRFFKPETIARFTDPRNTGQALGWMKPDKADWTGRLFSRESYGFINPDGLFLWIDPQKDLFIILCTPIEKEAEEAAILKDYEKIIESIVNHIDQNPQK